MYARNWRQPKYSYLPPLPMALLQPSLNSRLHDGKRQNIKKSVNITASTKSDKAPNTTINIINECILIDKVLSQKPCPPFLSAAIQRQKLFDINATSTPLITVQPPFAAPKQLPHFFRYRRPLAAKRYVFVTMTMEPDSKSIHECRLHPCYDFTFVAVQTNFKSQDISLRLFEDEAASINLNKQITLPDDKSAANVTHFDCSPPLLNYVPVSVIDFFYDDSISSNDSNEKV